MSPGPTISHRHGSVTGKIIWFIVIIVGSAIVGVAAYILHGRGVIPDALALPIYATVILVGGYLAIRVITAMLEAVVEPTIGVTRTHGVTNLFQIVAGAGLIAAAFGVFGFNITGLLVGAGFLGIVLGLAAQQVLGNVFAGVSLLISRPFEIGDRVTLAASTYSLMGSTYPHETQVSGFTGVVQEIGIFFTQVLLDDGNPSMFPNSVVIGSLIINHSRRDHRSVRVRVNLGRGLDYDVFKSSLLESLRKYETVDADRSSVEIVDLGDSTYQVLVSVWARSVSDESVKTMVIRQAMRIQKELNLPHGGAASPSGAGPSDGLG
jgi:small conductance mechanosensitive channel